MHRRPFEEMVGLLRTQLGFTVQLRTHAIVPVPRTGWIVGGAGRQAGHRLELLPRPEPSLNDDALVDLIVDWYRDTVLPFLQGPDFVTIRSETTLGVYLGGWFDPVRENYSIEVVNHYSDFEQACRAGVEIGEDAIWDLALQRPFDLRTGL
jgi:hypothetical protein